MINEELALCAKANFENLEKMIPALSKHPFYMIAKAQLDEALGQENAMEKRLGLVKEIERINFNDDGSPRFSGSIASIEVIDEKT